MPIWSPWGFTCAQLMWNKPHTIKGTTKAAEDDPLDSIIVLCMKSNYCPAQLLGARMCQECRSWEQQTKYLGARQAKQAGQRGFWQKAPSWDKVQIFKLVCYYKRALTWNCNT